MPELSNIPAPYCFEPWKLTKTEQQRYNMIIGVDYPFPILLRTEPSPTIKTTTSNTTSIPMQVTTTTKDMTKLTNITNTVGTNEKKRNRVQHF